MSFAAHFPLADRRFADSDANSDVDRQGFRLCSRTKLILCARAISTFRRPREGCSTYRPEVCDAFVSLYLESHCF